MYNLHITEQEADTIRFVGYRYAWSSVLEDIIHPLEGKHKIPEHKAWMILEAFELDTEGGHSFFPMLDDRSTLYDKLTQFMQSIV